MREPKTEGELKELIEQKLGRDCFVEIHADSTVGWRAQVVSNFLRRQQLQLQADTIAHELRGQFVLKLRRADAQAILRDELHHPAVVVQIVGTDRSNYQVEIRGGDINTQKSADGIFARLKDLFDIE
jgi:hypothetical protein